MTDHMPPPEEPLNDQARARIRAELLAAARPAPSSRRWAVPATAAASVALVAGLTAWATGVVGGGAGDGAGPATGTSESPPAEPLPPVVTDPEAVPTESLPVEPVPSGQTPPAAPVTPEEGEPSATPAATEAGAGACQAELEHVLQGAQQVAAFPKEDGGTTSFWVKGGRFSVCNERAGVTTVHKPLPLEPDLDDVATFRVSSVYQAPTPDGYRTIRVAGGLVPDGALAFDVIYTFPDGHTEQATKVTDDQGRTWWRMAYDYADAGGDEMQGPPIEVEVTLSGSGFGFTLEWGVDTCAQANHGC
jgi:hypothetical protein